jgi:hypothetical protein
MRTWFIVAVALVLAAVLFALSIPAVSTGIGKSDSTEALNNCTQLQIAIQGFFDENGHFPRSVSALHEQGYIDDDLLGGLSDGKGVYVIFLREDMNEDDIFIEAFLPKRHLTMTAGGDGSIRQIRRLKHKQK